MPPSEARLATEGLTQCRAPLHETPELHRSEPLPPVRRYAAPFLSLQGVRPAVASLASLGGTSGQTPARHLFPATVRFCDRFCQISTRQRADDTSALRAEPRSAHDRMGARRASEAQQILQNLIQNRTVAGF